MKFKILLKNIFEVYNCVGYKTLCIFGIRIKLKKKNLKIAKAIYSDLKINPNKIIFTNFFAFGGFWCNPKYIAEHLLLNNSKYEIVWITGKKFIKDSNFPPNIKLVDADGQEAIKEFYTAKIIVTNIRIEGLYKRGMRNKSEHKKIRHFADDHILKFYRYFQNNFYILHFQIYC
jgi:hypothetical protein